MLTKPLQISELDSCYIYQWSSSRRLSSPELQLFYLSESIFFLFFYCLLINSSFNRFWFFFLATNHHYYRHQFIKRKESMYEYSYMYTHQSRNNWNVVFQHTFIALRYKIRSIHFDVWMSSFLVTICIKQVYVMFHF